MSLSITSTLRKGSPEKMDLPFLKIKDEILGKKYNISLVFVGDTLSKNLNNKYRGKNKVANILSFPISKDEGEIFINPKKAGQDAKNFDMKPLNFIGYLFIHGLLHLKGLPHGSKMEEKEKKLLKKFKI